MLENNCSGSCFLRCVKRIFAEQPFCNKHIIIIMKKRLFLAILLVASFSFASFAQLRPDDDGFPPDVPIPVVRPGNPPIIPANVVPLTFSSYLSGEATLYENSVEIVFSQPVCISSITLTNMENGKTRSKDFNNTTTDYAVVPSLSSNGLWDVCVRSGYTEYHATIFVDCYQSFHICPED